jgi:programmed cell death protein 5
VSVKPVDDDEQLDELRRRKLAELQQQAHSEQAQAAQRADAQTQRDVVMRAILEPEARERLVRVRMARADIADALEGQLMTLYQQGRIQRRIDDETLRQLLARVTPKSRETTIERR